MWRVLLADGTDLPSHTLVWCVGVRPDPLVENLGLDIAKGRIVVNEYLEVAGHPDVSACGDVTLVPALPRPGEITAMTAQLADRQGRRAAGNIAASLVAGSRRPYR